MGAIPNWFGYQGADLDAERMWWRAPQVVRHDPPPVAGERQVLEAWLDFHRQSLLSKCSGLAAE
jgi:hypothetical protein